MIPENNNFYSYFKSVNKAAIKQAFEEKGWAIRKAGLTDFELSNDWSELLLEGDEDTPLVNGRIDFNPANQTILDEVFASIGGSVAYEFYDEEDDLILEKKV